MDSCENAAREKPDYKKELGELLRSRISPLALRERLRGYHDSDIAQLLDTMDKASARRVLRSLDDESLSPILGYVEDVAPYLEELPTRKKVQVLSLMEEDDAAGYLRSLPRSERDLLLDLMDGPKRSSLSLLVSFDEEEFGSRMSTNLVKVDQRLVVKEARTSLVRQAADKDNISTVYVVDEDDRFFGAIDLKDLITTPDDVSVSEITTTSYPYVYAEDVIEDEIQHLADYAEDSIPVLDSEDRLRGVITAPDMVKLLDEAITEDYAKLGGLAAEEDLNEPVRLSLRKRLPWLLVLLGLGLVVSSVAGAFDAVIANLGVIVAFQSLILDMSGNVGTQSLAVTIRVLMDESLDGRSKARLVAKETSVGAANGLALCVCSFVLAGLHIWLAKGYAPWAAFAMSGCVGVSLLAGMTLSALVGTTVPILFKKLGIDPAVASGPFITTLNDLVATVVYYGLAWLLLQRLPL